VACGGDGGGYHRQTDRKRAQEEVYTSVDMMAGRPRSLGREELLIYTTQLYSPERRVPEAIGSLTRALAHPKRLIECLSHEQPQEKRSAVSGPSLSASSVSSPSYIDYYSMVLPNHLGVGGRRRQ
jgi:hypothetical protein